MAPPTLFSPGTQCSDMGVPTHLQGGVLFSGTHLRQMGR